MLFSNFPENTDFKREYHFKWLLSFVDSNQFDKNNPITQKLRTLFSDNELVKYVCSMASQVDIPDDEITSEPVKIGEFDIPVPTGVKHGDIVVTYLEDTNNTIYRFHKYWQSLLRVSNDYSNSSKGDLLLLNPVTSMCITATYKSVSRFYDESDDRSHLKQSPRNLFSDRLRTKERDSTITEDSFKQYENNGYDTDRETDTVYPCVYPSVIKRSSANHQGSGVSTITITYSRIPKLNHKMGVQYYKNGKWSWDNKNQIYT